MQSKALLSLIVLVYVVVAVVKADTRPYARSADAGVSDDYSEVPNYEFQWGVKDDESGNMFNQIETRNADSTKGAYYVALPDGRIQKVTYYVDGDSGFVAEVTYEGVANYPDESEGNTYN